MDDFLPVNSLKKHHDYNEPGNRNLVAAILEQAYSDAISNLAANQSEQARNFINENNEIFCQYCELLGMLPEYVARKMKKRIWEKDQIRAALAPKVVLRFGAKAQIIKN